MWNLYVPKRVEKEISAFPESLQKTVHHKLEELRKDPQPAGCKKLKGSLQCWRIRVRTYRILYDIDSSHHTVLILKIGPRKDVYRSL